MRKNGFSLSEILFGIGIIGVIAVLTVPILMNNYNKKAFEVERNKAISELSQAGATAIAMASEYTYNNTPTFKNNTLLKDFLTTSTYCGKSPGNCFGAAYKDKDDKPVNISDYMGTNLECATAYSNYSVCLEQNKGILDLNGFKAPNKFGVDTYAITIGTDGNVEVAEFVKN